MGNISCAGYYVSMLVRLTHNRPAAPLRARSQILSVTTNIIRDPHPARARPRTDPAASALKRSPTLVSSDASGCVPCVPVRSAIGGLGPYLINFFALYELFRIVWVSYRIVHRATRLTAAWQCFVW